MIIVPIDKALPDNEIESLIKRSKVEAIVFENKYKDNIVKIKNKGQTNLEYLINMDEDKELRNISIISK